MRRVVLGLIVVMVTASVVAGWLSRAEAEPSSRERLLQRRRELARSIIFNLGFVDASSRTLDVATLKTVNERLERIKEELATLSDPNGLEKLSKQVRISSAKRTLGSMRSALSIFYGDAEGEYPSHLTELVPRHLPALPPLDLPGHERTETVLILDARDDEELQGQLEDTGGWAYVADPHSRMYGMVVIDCTHADASGRTLSTY